ncbi:glycoside hydrolase superfamily [Auriculariales sp. MPI-PUGE-AT-0066]|nr:glycoside hydrolase superfamily [Auriculariales sp. MPI-PUGE-AT-0066]
MALLSLIALALAMASSGAALLPVPVDEFRRAGIPDTFVRRTLDSSSTDKCTINETFPAPTLPSVFDLLKRSAFVTRKGTQLYLAGEPFRMTGVNAYWLGVDENVVPNPSYPSKSRVLQAMATVSAMRGTTIRSHTLAASAGFPLAVVPELDVFNDVAYEPIDFAILAARVYGLKLVIPLTDNYNWYHGGKYQFIKWHGIDFQGQGADITPADVGAYFYNTTEIVDSFKRFITHHLSHVNQYTGIAYKDDPTILGWETGNELAATRFRDGPAPPAWTKDIAQLLKKLAPKHLVFDGTYGLYPGTGQLEVKEVDVYSDHFYPLDITKFESGVKLVQAADRVYYAGEFDWTGEHGGDELDAFLKAVEAQPGAGTAIWSLFGHSDDCCTWVEHGDGFSFYYQRDEHYIAQGETLIAHAERMNSGKAKPEILPIIACPSLGAGGVAQKLLEPFIPRGSGGAAILNAL